ncbi:kynureninase [Halococcus thailandensis]|uniref:Kynureninase n=1 Tax=Halococcus thailandensis JCM 13552 TaxID=1227457 RepID=M0N417_9EURY|nr:kynureninase [Halococcus thailandensis]EMA51435.1 kynureninase [Halococcus thailandensis JCM 13552]
MPAFDASREGATARDEADPLAGFADRFHRSDELYLDGNSLGPLSTDAHRTLERVIDEWRELGIRGWTDGDPPWFRYGEYLGDRLAPLLGVGESEVVAANATTVNIHTLVGTFLDTIDGRPTVLVDELNFPTDGYAVRAQLRQRGFDPDNRLVVVESDDGRTIDEDDVVTALETNDVDLLLLPSVLYRSGQLLDVDRIATAAADAGTICGFDLAHSIGVVPHDLSNVDFAVWCSYKYLNAGPGAIAGLYVNERHFGTQPALAGWWGHEKETQFAMRSTYTPANTAGAWQIGTVPMLSAAPLEGALDIVDEAGIDAIREKSLDLTAYLIELVDEQLDDSFVIGTPRERARRGGHVAIEHPHAERLAAALAARDAVVDFRPPNVVRVCPAPLYTSYVDVWEFVATLAEIAESGAYERFDPDGTVT